MKSIAMAAVAAVALFSASAASAEGVTVTGRAGFTEGDYTTVGVGVAYNLNDTFAVEGTYDRVLVDNFDDANVFSANLVASLPVTEKVSVYALAGAGYQDLGGFSENNWTVGLGATYELTPRVSLDARARRTEGFDSGVSFETVTFGAAYRF